MLLWPAEKTYILPGDHVKQHPSVAQSSYDILKDIVCVLAEMQNFFVSFVKFVKMSQLHNNKEKRIYVFK